MAAADIKTDNPYEPPTEGAVEPVDRKIEIGGWLWGLAFASPFLMMSAAAALMFLLQEPARAVRVVSATLPSGLLLVYLARWWAETGFAVSWRRFGFLVVAQGALLSGLFLLAVKIDDRVTKGVPLITPDVSVVILGLFTTWVLVLSLLVRRRSRSLRRRRPATHG